MKRLTEEESLNRRVNFFIIREMWKIIRGRQTKNSRNDVYTATGISRNRYTRLLDGEPIRMTQTERDFIEEYIGVRTTLTAGKEMFKINGLSREIWENYFESRVSVEGRDLYRKIKNALIQAKSYEAMANPDIYRLCLAINKGKSSGNAQEVVIISIIEKLKLNTVEGLEWVSEEVLNKYIRILEKQIELCKAVLIYKNFKKHKN